ncbi:hypothetical protein GE061_008665 [Apolygus lucorum]|nr:hypothetical protein GE061_008665 [Apolygus lucorum]
MMDRREDERFRRELALEAEMELEERRSKIKCQRCGRRHSTLLQSTTEQSVAIHEGKKTEEVKEEAEEEEGGDWKTKCLKESQIGRSREEIQNADEGEETATSAVNLRKNVKHHVMLNTRTVRQLSLPTQSIDQEKLGKVCKLLADFEISSYDAAKPTILIGEDNWPLTVLLKVVHGPWDGPVATKTKLGWVVHGKMPIQLKGRVEDDDHGNHLMSHWEKEEEAKETDTFLHDLVGSHIRQDDVKEITEENSQQGMSFPTFLRKPEREWSVETSSNGPVRTRNEPEEIEVQFEGVEQEIEWELWHNIGNVFEGKWHTVLQTTALVSSIATSKHEYFKTRHKECLRECTDKELYWTEEKWVKKAQVEAFWEEIGGIRRKKTWVSSSRLCSLNPFLEKHQGQETIGGAVRLKLWVISTRKAVRGFLNRCVLCLTRRAVEVAPAAVLEEELQQDEVSQQLADRVRKKWWSRYVLTLAERSNWAVLVEPIKVGDLVG